VRGLRLILAGLAIVVLALPAAASAAVQLSGVDGSLYPTMRGSIVSSSGARFIPVVTENGLPVAGFEALNLGRKKAIAMLVDRSQSMRGKPLADASAAARAFVQAKQAADELAVIVFGARVSTLSPFSPAPLYAAEALSGLKTDTARGTALYDGIVVAADQLEANPLPGRVIIVLSDGADNASKRGLTAAIVAARNANAAVYAIGIEGQGFTSTQLEQITSSTGGQYYAAGSTKDLTAVYGKIAETLKKTWRFSYLTSARPGDKISMKASVVGDGSAAKSFRIAEGNATAAKPPSSLVPKDVYGPSGPLALALAVGGLVLLACLFFLTAFRGSWVRGRIAAFVGEARGNTKQKRKQKRSEALAAVFRATENAFGNLKQWHWVSRTLERADIQLKTVEFFWIVVGSGILAGMFAYLFGASLVLLIVVVVIAGSIPCGWVWLKMRKRLRAFEDQLPDLLITIAASLKAGHSFKQGLQAVVDEGHPPASEEIRRVLTETSLGRPMDDALADMAERLGSNNFEFAITAVTIQRQVGGSLATLFDMVADTVRQRQQFARKIRALTAMGRMSAYTLIGIPFFIAGAITLLNREYMRPLYFTSKGQVLIAVAFVMMAFGSLLLKKIVSFRG